MILSKEEKIQYDRHLILSEIGLKGQEKLKQAKVLVIGAGGLGCPVLQALTAAGVGTIGIIDDDIVDQSNLQRQILYTHKDIGVSKVVSAINRLSNMNPFVQFNAFQERLTKDNALTIFSVYDIIVDGSDNFPTRYLVNDAAIITGKPVVFGALYKFEGQLSVYNYQGGPSYRCLFPDPPQIGEMPNCSEIGVLGVIPSIIGALQANEVIKMICGIGEILSGKLLSINALSLEWIKIKYSKTDANQIDSLALNYEEVCGLSKELVEISKEALSVHKNEYSLLDVRTIEERKEHHIGGQHIPLDELTIRYKEIKTNTPLVVYCAAGMRSQKAIQILQTLGITQTMFNLKGGIR